METVIFSMLIALVFYLLVPGFGAIYVRNQWRHFRRRIAQSSLFPLAAYHSMRGEKSGFLGSFRFLGTLEAIQDDATVWIRNGRLSLSAEVRQVLVYILPSSDGNVGGGSAMPDEPPRQVPWSRIFSLPGGTRVYVAGALYWERDRGIFRSTKREPLTLVIYDGDERSIIDRSVWCGRHRNEFWNQFTPVSLAIGAFSLVIIAYNLFRFPLLRFPALLTLTLSLMPVIPLLPPGIACIFLYSSLWRKARTHRAERDSIRLPLRYFYPEPENRPDKSIPEKALLPDLSTYELRTYPSLADAVQDAPQAQVLSPDAKHRNVDMDGTYGCAFGSSATDGTLQPPDDPFAEHVIWSVDPAVLSSKKHTTAHILEVAAVVVFAVGVMLNTGLVFALLSAWIK